MVIIKEDFLIPTMFQNLWRYITGIDETITGENIILIDAFSGQKSLLRETGLHKLWYPGIRDTSTWSKFGAHGEHGDVFLFSNLGAL